MTDTTLSTLHGGVLSSIPAGGEIVLSVSVGGSRVFATVAPFTAGSGLTLTGTTFSLGSIPLLNLAAGGATNGQALTWNGVVWTPTTLAAGTTYTGVAPVSINGSGAISIQQGGATTGQALVWSGSVWAPGTIAIPAATSVLPLMDGTATVGTSTNYAREGHIHPSDASRLAAASNLSDLVSAGTARNNLGLGNAATLNGTAQGQIAYYSGTAWAVLAPGTSGQVLQTNGAGANPTWVAQTGGSGGGGSLTVVSVDGSTIIASTGSPYQMLSGDRVVDVNKGTGAATKILLPTSPITGVSYKVIDGKGDSATNNITVTGSSITINGSASFVIAENFDAFDFLAVNATTWRIV